MSKVEEMRQLKAEALAELVCDPARPESRVVWGEGDPQALVALVGEAPGEVEERRRRPFVGPAGALLDEMLERAGLSREEVWITNVVKCRPASETGGRWKNRPPRVAEIQTHLRWLDRELEVVDPTAVVCLGAVPARVLIDKGLRLAEQRGRVFERNGRRLLATYHPAYLLRLAGIDPQRYHALRMEVEGDLSLARTLGCELFDKPLPLP